jgi:opacity protein-like surface antigen
MKKLLIAAVVAAISSGAFAADLKPYIEGSIGRLNPDNIDSKNYSGSLDGSTLNAKLKLDYDSGNAYGGEVGFKNVGIPNLRIGASYSRAEIDLNQLSLLVNGTTTLVNDVGSTVGSLNANAQIDLNRGGISASGTGTVVDSVGNTDTLSGSISYTNAELNSGFVTEKNTILNGLKKTIKLYMVNTYYDFTNSTPFTPYVGFGLGMADINATKDKEFAYSAIAGAKYNFNPNFYLGMKGSFTRVNAPTSTALGAEIGLEDIDLKRADAVIGYEF